MKSNSSGVTGGEGEEYPLTFFTEKILLPTGKRENRGKEKGKMEKKRRNIVKGKGRGKLKSKGKKYDFFFHFSEPLKFVYSLNSRDLFLSLIDLLKWQNFFRI